MKKQDLKVGGQYHFLGDNKISLLYMGKECYSVNVDGIVLDFDLVNYNLLMQAAQWC